jgi:hypothetical protein
MDSKNMKSSEFSTLNHMATVSNFSFIGKVTDLKMMSGLRLDYLKTAKHSILGMSLVGTAQALHDTFHQGFNFSPGV